MSSQVFVYGPNNWTLTKSQCNRIESGKMRFLRHVMRDTLHYNKRSDCTRWELRNITGILEKVKQYLIRMDDCRILKRNTKPKEQRRVGCLHKSWSWLGLELAYLASEQANRGLPLLMKFTTHGFRFSHRLRRVCIAHLWIRNSFWYANYSFKIGTCFNLNSIHPSIRLICIIYYVTEVSGMTLLHNSKRLFSVMNKEIYYFCLFTQVYNIDIMLYPTAEQRLCTLHFRLLISLIHRY